MRATIVINISGIKQVWECVFQIRTKSMVGDGIDGQFLFYLVTAQHLLVIWVLDTLIIYHQARIPPRCFDCFHYFLIILEAALPRIRETT